MNVILPNCGKVMLFCAAKSLMAGPGVAAKAETGALTVAAAMATAATATVIAVPRVAHLMEAIFHNAPL